MLDVFEERRHPRPAWAEDRTGQDVTGEPEYPSEIAIVPFWVVSARGVTLRARRAIAARVSCGETHVLIDNDSLGIYAAGESTEDAVRDFNEQIIDQFRFYSQIHEDQTIGEGRRLKRLFGELFSEV